MAGSQSTSQARPVPMPPGQPRTSGQRPARKVWWLLGAGVVVLALLVTGGVVLVRGGLGTSKEKRATEAAQRFMTAYAAGDASTLQGFFSDAVKAMRDLSLITDKVLTTSTKQAPIGQVEIRKPREGNLDNYTVPVAFTLGSRTVSMELGVTTYTSRPPTVNPGLVMLDLHGVKAMGAQVNGAAPATSMPSVLPGSYHITGSSQLGVWGLVVLGSGGLVAEGC